MCDVAAYTPPIRGGSRPFFNGIKPLKDKQPQIFFLLQRLCPSSPTFLEAGANQGEDTFFFANLWPKGKIFAFEPFPHSYAKLVEKVSAFDNVYPVPYALGEQTANVPFYIRKVNTGGSSLFRHETETDSTIEVKCWNLDEWCAEEKIQSIDGMWLDLEGMELSVLKSSPKILETVSVILTETNSQNNPSNYPPNKDELIQFLIDRGFIMIAHWYGSNQGDALFIRECLLNKLPSQY